VRTMKARKSDPVTSHEAAESVKNLSATKEGILIALGSRSMSDSQIAWEYNRLVLSNKAPMASESGLRSRRSELVADGLVEADGFGKTPFGRRTILWKVVR
jgi:hypothetical protein